MIETDDYIIKLVDSSHKKWSFESKHKNNLVFYKSIQQLGILENCNLYKNSTTICDDDDEEIQLHFFARSVQPLCHFFTNNELDNGDKKSVVTDKYDFSMRALYCLSKQQNILFENGLGFHTLDINDIYVFNGRDVLCVNPSLSYPVIKQTHTHDGTNNIKYMFHFKSPFIRNRMSSPELLNMCSLPTKTDALKTYHYTLAIFVYFCLFGVPYNRGDSLETDINLKQIIYTKHYWFMKKMLTSTPELRPDTINII